MRILIMGLPGSGKTFLSEALKKYLEDQNKSVTWLNADMVRKQYNDWDFSYDGRIRQSKRMYKLSTNSKSCYVICDFIAPLVEMRKNLKADITIWVDTIKSGRFKDTNKIFIPPDKYDFRVTEQDCEKWSKIIGEYIKEK